MSSKATQSLVILPTYNERDNIPVVIPRLAAIPSVDVLVIDDNSPDGSGTLADSLRGRYPRLSVLHRRRKEGLGRAYVQGFREALRRGYRRIVTMDADLSHAPEDVPRLLAGLDDADVAIGSRHIRGGGVSGWPVRRMLLSRMGGLYARSVLRLGLRDVTSGFRAYRADALSRLDWGALRSRGFVFQVEILRRLLDLEGSRAVEVPILFRNRSAGSSKLGGRIVLEAVLEVTRLVFRERAGGLSPADPGVDGESLPPVTVVVPVPPGSGEPDAVRGLRELRYPREKFEVVVSEGNAPAAQRNAAARASRGEYLLFLDDDSLATPELLLHYVSAFRRDRELGAVGGPAVWAGGGGLIESGCAAAFSEPLVLGRSASRYAPRGRPRLVDERELILCNLAVCREAFESAGGFHPDLYPNEENEFLERLRRRGWKLFYRPEAEVRRPHRRTVREVASSAYRYGSGRAAQGRRAFSKVTASRFALSLCLAGAAASTAAALVRGESWLMLPALLYALYLALVFCKLALRKGLRPAAAGALLAPVIHGSYAAGVLAGCFFGRNNVRREAAGGQGGQEGAGVLRRVAVGLFLAVILPPLLGTDSSPAEDSVAVAEDSVGATPERGFYLPFPPRRSYEVLFGPGDPPHHLDARNRYAYDFALPSGSEVAAARAGVVTHVEGRFSGRTGRSRENNFVRIRHADGTVSEYHHLLQDGVLVRSGESVERGEVIGFSGQSGKAEGPHLHFVVLRGERSRPVRFESLEDSPEKGSICTSRNVPPSRARRFEVLVRGLKLADFLVGERRPVPALILLEALRTRASRGETPPERRRALALGPLREEVVSRSNHIRRTILGRHET